jgi:hypothetical protein
VPDVADDDLDPRRAAGVATQLLGPLDAAEAAQRLGTGGAGRHPFRLQALGFAFEMVLQLLAQIGLAPIPTQQRAHPAPQDVPGASHDVLASTRLTPAERRSHFERSVWTCFRPARVSE